MNNILKLRPQIIKKGPPIRGGGLSLRKGKFVKYNHIIKLIKELEDVYNYFIQVSLINGSLVSVTYDSLVPKSRRIKTLFTFEGVDANDLIKGAKFEGKTNIRHVITYFLKLDKLKRAIKDLNKVANLVNAEFGGIVDEENFIKELYFKKYSISKTRFRQIIVDLSSIAKFDVLEYPEGEEESSIITLYETDKSNEDILNEIGIKVYQQRMLDNNTVLLNKNEIELIKSKAPYLISMAVNDISKLDKYDFMEVDDSLITIEDPKNEPTIGVIDTMFDERVYFSKWVEFKNMLSKEIELESEDYFHGTAVSSIIVDGPSFNKDLDDGCGRFRVKHFGVSTQRRFSSFRIINAIKEIVSKNTDIKVWNLSLGSNAEINRSFISAEGSILDKIQHENDCIFVIAATNKPKKYENNDNYKIGSPADSINSLVVASVNKRGEPANYSRKGLVLSFFHKPDVSYYGGVTSDCIKAVTATGLYKVNGTSFAAPWIARKLSFLIDKLGFSREEAKALIIDSTMDFDEKLNISEMAFIGRGVVPIHINDIVKTKKDEIKFIISGNVDTYETYFHNLPVPVVNGKHPYKAKGTLCYFPYTNRNQGVDYTQTELDLYFGRINDETVRSVDKNVQTFDGFYVDEKTARENFRKWDNVKHVKDVITERSRSLKAYEKNLWGFKINRKSRTDNINDKELRFGLVVTLKEINGVNRIDDFIQSCLFRGIAVNEIDVLNILDIYAKAEKTIVFD